MQNTEDSHGGVKVRKVPVWLAKLLIGDGACR
jgi:hypothetical protein